MDSDNKTLFNCVLHSTGLCVCVCVCVRAFVVVVVFVVVVNDVCFSLVFIAL